MNRNSVCDCIILEFVEEMRKESDEEDEFYDRTLKIVEMSVDDKSKYRNQAQGKSYEELKLRLEDLLSQKTEVSEDLVKIAASERSALAVQKDNEEDLDKLIREDETALRTENRSQLILKMKDLVAEIDE
jgi:hypothetical protein